MPDRKKRSTVSAPDFQILFESSPGLYLVLSTDLTILAASEAYLRATMTKLNDITGRNVFDVFPDNPNDPLATGVHNLTESLNRVLKNKTADTMAVQKYDIKKPESEGGMFEERFWSPVNSPVFDKKGEVMYILHRAEDITEYIKLRHKDSEQLKENNELRTLAQQMEYEIYQNSQMVAETNQKLQAANQELAKLYELTKASGEARLSAILDNTVDGMITIDERGQIEHFNRACERVFGYALEEVIGKNMKMLMPDPYHSEHDQYLSNYKATGEAKIIGIGREVVARRKDGSVFPIDLSVSRVTLGTRTIYSGIIRDITERKQAEAEREKLIEKLTSSNEELGRFAYVASHDLKEPLRMVTSFTSLLEKKYGENLDEKARQYISFAREGGERMQQLVDDLLEYARVGAEDERFEAVNCNDAIGVAKTNLTLQISESGAQIVHEALPVVRANAVRMTMLLQNLISNAIKYQTPGNIPRIEIKCEQKPASFLFSVCDNGIGIKEEYLAKIFEPFKRLHTKEVYRGTGIGLAISFKIVENWGGKIWATSQPGRGTNIFFEIPAGIQVKTTAS